MNYNTLRTEIFVTNPELYAGFSAEDIANELNAVDQKVLKPDYVDACMSQRTLDYILGGEKTTWVLNAIAALGTPEATRYLTYLQDVSGAYPGVDSRAQEFRDMVDSLIAFAASESETPVITTADGERLKDYAYHTVSLAGSLGLGTVLPGHVQKVLAMENDE